MSPKAPSPDHVTGPLLKEMHVAGLAHPGCWTSINSAAVRCAEKNGSVKVRLSIGEQNIDLEWCASLVASE
jgi:hypothetical protein